MVGTDGKEMKGNELVLSLFGVNQGREYSLHFETREEGKKLRKRAKIVRGHFFQEEKKTINY